ANHLELWIPPGGRRDAEQLALDSRRSHLIDAMFSNARPTRVAATSELIREWRQDPQLDSLVVQRGLKDTSNMNGTINSLVVLRELPQESLNATSGDLSLFLTSARENGPQTAALVDQVTQRVDGP